MMKICIIKATLAVAFIAVAGYTANNIQKEEVALSEIALQNVEALARGEGSGIPYKGFYANWNKGGCCEQGRWNDECPNSMCK